MSSDDIAALYVCRFGVERLPYTVSEIATRKGIKVGSFKMRVQNFHALGGKGGLTHYARQSKEIYERLKTMPEAELRKLAFPEL